MRIQETELQGTYLIEPERHSDNRGFFALKATTFKKYFAGLGFSV